MPRVITSLCLREGVCATVCPVECIIPGIPQDEWPSYYIDADTCIDCGACEAACPHQAIYPDDEVPSSFTAKGGEILSMPAGTPGYTHTYEGTDANNQPVMLKATKVMKTGESIDLTPAIEVNKAFFGTGPGYKAQE